MLKLVQPRSVARNGLPYEPAVAVDDFDDEALADVIQRLADQTEVPPNVVFQVLQQSFPDWTGLKDPSFILNMDYKWFREWMPKRIRKASGVI